MKNCLREGTELMKILDMVMGGRVQEDAGTTRLLVPYTTFPKAGDSGDLFISLQTFAVF